MTTQTKPTCQVQVPQYPGSYLYRDCGVTASFHEADPARTEGGKLKWYCRRHAPSIVAAKNVTRNAAWDAKWAAERAEAEAKQRQQAEDARKLAAFDDLLDAAKTISTMADTMSHFPFLKTHALTAAEQLKRSMAEIRDKAEAAIKKARTK